jgi:hypothetical protein
MDRRIRLSAIAVLVAGALMFPAAAQANTAPDLPIGGATVSDAKAAELDALLAIAGQPVSYAPEGSEGAGVAARAAALDPYKCTLYPSVVHLRKSGNYGTVGAKPYTKCTAGTSTTITHDTVLYMVEWAGLSYVSLTGFPQIGTNTPSLTMKQLEWSCKNTNTSRFAQETKGSSIQAGTTYYSTVVTPIAELKCGK